MEILDNLPFLLKKQDKNERLGSSGKYRERAIFPICNQQVAGSSPFDGSRENKDLRVTPRVLFSFGVPPGFHQKKNGGDWHASCLDTPHSLDSLRDASGR